MERGWRALLYALSDSTIPLSTGDASGTSWERLTDGEMNRPLVSAEASLVRASLVAGPGSTTLFLTFNHAVTDGMGAFFVMREVLTALSGAELSSEVADARLEDMIGLEVPRFLRNPANSSVNRHRNGTPYRLPKGALTQFR